MDNIDRAIVEILSENSKLGTKEIAVQVGLTITPTYERIKMGKETYQGYNIFLSQIDPQHETFCSQPKKLSTSPLYL